MKSEHVADYLKKVKTKDLAAWAGVPARRDTHSPAAKVRVRVDYFKLEDPEHSIITPSGVAFPMGQPVEELRAQLGGSEGVIHDPYGNPHNIKIPPNVKDGEATWVSVRFDSLNRDDLSFDVVDQLDAREH